MGSGGGGGAGASDWPDYLKEIHYDMLYGKDSILVPQFNGSSVTDAMIAAYGNSPYSGVTAFPVDTDITAMETAIGDWDTLLAGINEEADWDSLFTQAETSIGAFVAAVIADMAVADMTIPTIPAATIAADVAALGAIIDDEINTRVLPRFRRGMQNICAVVSSSFAIGQAVIEGMRDRDLAKHGSELYRNAETENVKIELEARRSNLEKDVTVGKSNMLKEIELNKLNTSGTIEYAKLYSESTRQMLQFLMQKYMWEESYAKLVIESRRIKIVAKSEETANNLDIEAKDSRWDLESFQYGANMLAAISGGTQLAGKNETEINQTASTIGGALSGAAAGAQIGSSYPPYGTAIGAGIGAIVGGVGSYLAS
jgi:succinate dehydrogenase flavin-adding protein (antitoxin of CptAB toxin-antitoxin module)/uncharacterized membrane protein